MKDFILKVKRKIYYRQNIYIKYLTDCKSFPITQINNRFSIVKVGRTHEHLLREYSNLFRSEEHFVKNIKLRLQKENRFVGFAVIDLDKNNIAYLAWIDREQIELKDAKLFKQLKLNQSYFFDDHCVFGYRRKGLHKRIFEERMNYCIDSGVEEVFIAIMNDNKIAINNLYKFKFELLKSISVYPLINMLSRKIAIALKR